ncbi:HAD family hydrolase [Microvirga sp. TS319]|uniref:HAD family hydrolase n=1 Tax=Microvirga sp. TS319 TaxID=3241165 RepID=UPI003519EA9A
MQHLTLAGAPSPVIHQFGHLARVITSSSDRAALFRDRGHELAQKHIWPLLEGIEILSLDVFDTALLRNKKSEARRYFEMAKGFVAYLRDAERLPDIQVAAIDVLLARALGMGVSYRARTPVQGSREGSIDDVNEICARILRLDQDTKSTLLKMEVDYEVGNLVPNAMLLEISEHFRAAGGKVILLSDMYLPAPAIEEIAERVAGKRFFDHVFSSCDFVVSKRSGRIFKEVEDVLKAQSSQFLHIGDSLLGDVTRARQAGWQALHLPISNTEVTEREEDLFLFLEEMSAMGIDVSPWAKV